jgi:hypothetical protein
VRGEPAFPIEQLVRDAEMYRIGEGATDILRPFVAREGLHLHLDRAHRYFEEELPAGRRLRELIRLIRFYVPWYLGKWRRRALPAEIGMRHLEGTAILRYVERTSRRLARAIFYAMVLYRERLKDDQGRQNRIEAVGEALFVLAAATLHASAQEREGLRAGWDLVREFFRASRPRIRRQIRELLINQDQSLTVIGGRALRGEYRSLSGGAIRRGLDDYRPKT